MFKEFKEAALPFSIFSLTIKDLESNWIKIRSVGWGLLLNRSV